MSEVPRRSMDPEMFSLYPSGIRVLLVDDDSRFIRKASTLLSLLNFKVSTCGCPSSALKVLSEADKFKDVDVVLVDAKKATTCGFDFRAIVETDLRVPVVYFLSQNHKSTGDEADALLRTLDTASFIMKKPFDSDDICNLWRDIAWRKCCLNSKTGGVGATAGEGSSSSSGKRPMPPWAGWSSSFNDDGEEERVHFRVISGVRGRKRKGVVLNNPGSPSGSSCVQAPAARRRGRPPKNREQTTVVAGNQETERVAEPVPCKSRSKKGQKNGESASMLPEIPEDMDAEPQPPQPKQSLFVQSVLQTLDVPPYNPSIFADAVERGSNIISFSGAGKTTAVAPASTPLHQAPQAPATPAPANQASQAPAPPPANQAPQAPAPPPVHQAPLAPAPPPVHQAPLAPAPPPVHQAPLAPAPPPVHQAPLAPAPAAVCPAPAAAPPAVQRQQQIPAVNVIGKVAPPAAETIMSTAFTVQEADISNLLLCGFGPFPYQGPAPPASMQQDIFAPRNFPTWNGNIQLPLQQQQQSLNITAGDPFTAGTVDGAAIEAADDATHAGGDYGNTANTVMQPLQLGDAAQNEVAGMMAMYSSNPQLMAPQHVDDVAAMYYYNNNDAAMYCDNNGELFVVPHQVHGMAYDVNNPVMAGGAFDGNAAAFMAPNVNQLGMEDDPASMFASDENGDYSFPLEALMGTDWHMYEYDAGLAGQQGQGGSAEGAAASVNAAGIYLNAGEGSMGPADEIAAMLDDMLMNNVASDLFPNYMNNNRE